MKTTMDAIGQRTQNRFFTEAEQIVERGKTLAFQSVNTTMITTFWQLGQRIVQEEQNGNSRAEYGSKLLHNLSAHLTEKHGKGYSERNLRIFRQFYLEYPEPDSIWHTCVPNLSWSHLKLLLRVSDKTARDWYLQEASNENWNVRTLERNIASQYYYRLLQTPEQSKATVRNEMISLTGELQADKLEFIKNPLVAEFLGFESNFEFTESKLESAILTHLQKFLMELGKGYAFVARQQRISTDAGDYYIDLVFYNVILKCYVLIDLKTAKISHQDIGQMDMYVRMYDELKRTQGDNPTLGIVLCSETSEDIAKYSVLHDSNQLFATKYLTYLPSEEQLRNEIIRQKNIFSLSCGCNKIKQG